MTRVWNVVHRRATAVDGDSLTPRSKLLGGYVSGCCTAAEAVAKSSERTILTRDLSRGRREKPLKREACVRCRPIIAGRTPSTPAKNPPICAKKATPLPVSRPRAARPPLSCNRNQNPTTTQAEQRNQEEADEHGDWRTRIEHEVRAEYPRDGTGRAHHRRRTSDVGQDLRERRAHTHAK